ncbi:MAG: LLM class flavin-dependent oxidoreductase [Chloroflexi bacterium]|nr:LLM class flavin-dependent oxidoreductase [Chloroflexota bacterium]MYF23053.1 LLM class flavin-dependent oxidoreductase [Chloroflexota bacterium]
MTARPAPRFSWFVPIDGDGDRIGSLRAQRLPTFEYLRDVVLNAERLGYHSLLIPTRFANGSFEHSAPLAETWTTATALCAVSSRIRLLIAVRPGVTPVGLFAQQAATLHEISRGRIDINIVPGGIQGDNERLGITGSHDDRYAQADEFIDACAQLWKTGGPLSYEGESLRLNGAIVSPTPTHPEPEWYLGGASDAALRLAAERADVLLCWIQPPEPMEALLDRARDAFALAKRIPRFGLRTHLVVRDTEAEAWDAAAELLSDAHPDVLAQRAAAVQSTAMVGAAAQARRVEDDRLGERLWNGISRVRVNLGTAIVGTPQQAADELSAYGRLGFDEFILSGYPHLEEAERIARDVIPLVEAAERDPLSVYDTASPARGSGS